MSWFYPYTTNFPQFSYTPLQDVDIENSSTQVFYLSYTHKTLTQTQNQAIVNTKTTYHLQTITYTIHQLWLILVDTWIQELLLMLPLMKPNLV